MWELPHSSAPHWSPSWSGSPASGEKCMGKTLTNDQANEVVHTVKGIPHSGWFSHSLGYGLCQRKLWVAAQPLMHTDSINTSLSQHIHVYINTITPRGKATTPKNSSFLGEKQKKRAASDETQTRDIRQMLNQPSYRSSPAGQAESLLTCMSVRRFFSILHVHTRLRATTP